MMGDKGEYWMGVVKFSLLFVMSVYLSSGTRKYFGSHEQKELIMSYSERYSIRYI